MANNNASTQSNFTTVKDSLLNEYFEEEFMNENLKDIDEKLVENMNALHKIDFLLLNIMEEIMNRNKNKKDSLEMKKYLYLDLRCEMSVLYRGFTKTKQQIDQNVLNQIKNMSWLMYQLDRECGTNEPLDPKDSMKEYEKKIKLLDEDRDKFISIIDSNYKSILKDRIGCKTFIMFFAKLLFEFNGYQAPPRFDQKKAVEDSMGITDVFQEYFDAIENKYK
jgi:hypothetical protein